MSLCKGGVGWDWVARLLLWLDVLVFQFLGSFHSLYLKFDKVLRAIASYVLWVATVNTQVVCPSVKFFGFYQRFKFSCVDLHRAGPKEAGRATGVVWGTKGSVVGWLFQSWALEVTFFSWRHSNRRLSHRIAWVMASLKEEGSASVSKRSWTSSRSPQGNWSIKAASP
jgi:hypothetical protein